MKHQFSYWCEKSEMIMRIKMKFVSYFWGYDQTNIENEGLVKVRIEITKKTSDSK